MKIKFLSYDTVNRLKNDIGKNLDVYLQGDVSSLIDEGEVFESRMEVKDDCPVLDIGDHKGDFENSKKIFKWLNSLDRTLSSDPRLWTFLTHCVFNEYVRKRWSTSVSEGSIKDRYFYTGAGLNELNRNAVARLWWGAKRTYDDSMKNPWSRTATLYEYQDIPTAFLERSLGNCPVLLEIALDVIKDNLKHLREFDGAPSTVIQQWARFLNLYAGSVLIDAVPVDRLRAVIEMRLKGMINS